MSPNSPHEDANWMKFRHTDESWRLQVISVAFMVTTTIFLILFYFSRLTSNLAHGADFFFFIPFGFLFGLACCGLGLALVYKRFAGHHMVSVILAHGKGRVQIGYNLAKALYFAYMPAVMFPKLAIASLYLHIFVTRTSRITTYITISVIIGICLSGILTVSISCLRQGCRWDADLGWSDRAYRYLSILNIITDFVLLVLPLPVVYRMQIKTEVKLGLILTFFCGSIGIVAGTLRAYNLFYFNMHSDPTYLSIYIDSWTIIEPCTYFICACMPSLRPLKRKLLGTFSISGLLIISLKKLSPKRNKKRSKTSSNIRSGILKTTEIGIVPAEEATLSQAPNNGWRFSQTQPESSFIRLEDR